MADPEGLEPSTSTSVA